MGVRGLTTYVRETLTWEREEEVLPRGSILLVDGNGWGWSLLENKVRVYMFFFFIPFLAAELTLLLLPATWPP